MVLFIVVIGKKIQMLLNFMIRIVLGGIGIIYANDFFTSQGIAISVGLNPVSLLTIGILGIGAVSYTHLTAFIKTSKIKEQDMVSLII